MLTPRKYLLACEGPQGSLVHEKRVDPPPCAQQRGALDGTTRESGLAR